MSGGTDSNYPNGTSPGKGGFVPPSTGDLDAILDQYEFIKLLGRGGMGAVYQARQKSLDRLVAIKILPPHLTTDEEEQGFHFAERFQREARAMAKLSHPNIVAVYDFGQAKDGQFYFVMEYIEGTDLAALIKGGQMTTAHVTGWMSQICEALQYAHDKGIVHRDIKPANIMITREGNVKVADFGLAKLAGGDAAEQTKLTMTNMAMGTPDYVAPEVLEMGVVVDHRADLYALGVMLYEMLTGKVPRGAWRSPSTQIAGLDPRFDAVIDRAMDADRESRFQQAGEISATIYQIVNTPAGPSRPKLMMGPAAGPVKPAAAAPESAKKPPAPAVKAKEPARERPAPNAPVAKSPVPERRVAGPASRKRAGKPVSPLLVIGGLALGAVAVGFGVYAIFKPDLPDKPATTPDKVAVSTPAPAPPNPAPANPAPATASGSPRFSPSTEPWVDRMPEVLASKYPSSRTEGIGRFFGNTTRIGLKGGMTDGAIRVLFAPGSEKQTIVYLRNGSTTGSYMLHTHDSVVMSFSEVATGVHSLGTTVNYPSPGVRQPGKPIEVELRAVGPKLTGKVNGQVMIEREDTQYTAGSYSVSVGPGAILYAVQTLDLSKPAQAAAPMPTTTSNGWIDGLSEWLAAPENSGKGTLQKEGASWRFKGPEAIGLGAKLTTPRVAANVAVRYSVRLDSKNSSAIILLRTQKAAGSFYQATVYGSGLAQINLSKDMQLTRLASFPIPAGFDETAVHVIEFRAEGHKLTLLVDGVERGTANDSTHASGGVSVTNGLIEKIEYRDLGPLNVTSPPPVAGEQWVDVLAAEWAKPEDKRSANLVKEADGARIVGLGGYYFAPGHRNLAMRAVLRGGDASELSLNLRSLNGGYSVIIDRKGQGRLLLILIKPGERSQRTELAKFTLPAGFSLADRHTAEFRVDVDEITFSLDGQELARVRDRGKGSGDASIVGKGVLIEKLETVNLGPDPILDLGSAAATAPTGGEKWVDGLAEWWALPANAQSGLLTKETGGSRVTRDLGVSEFLALGSGKNVAIRATVHAGVTDYWSLFARKTGAGEATNFYAAGFRGGSALLRMRVEGVDQFIRQSAPLMGFSLDRSQTVELRIQGDVLTITVNGKVVARARDDTHKDSGTLAIFAKVGALIEKLEYCDLGADPPSAAPPSATKEPAVANDQWVDGLAEWWAVPANAQSGLLVKEAGGLRVVKNNGSGFHFGKGLDIAVRAKARAPSGASWLVGLRAALAKNYTVQLADRGRPTTVREAADNVSTILKTLDLPADFSIAATHTLEFHAQGDLLTVLLDGTELARLRDNSIAESGSVYFSAGPDAIIESFEYRELSPPGAATSPSPSLAVSASSVASATKDTPFVNSLGMKFVPVPITGGPTDGRTVLFSIWETRRSDYQPFVSATKRTWQPHPWNMAGFEETPDHPAVAASWEDATEFCAWLTKQERESGKIAKDAVYRLPKDHEWSCAVGIGDKENPTASPTEKSGGIEGYYWGTVWPPPPGVENFYGEESQSVPYGNVAPLAGYRDPFPRTAPVGSFKPNELGLYDLGGNVHEWCEEMPGTDLAHERRVTRGGAWWQKYEERDFFLSSKRTDHLRTARFGFDGFRVVLELPASGDAPLAPAPPLAVPAASYDWVAAKRKAGLPPGLVDDGTRLRAAQSGGHFWTVGTDAKVRAAWSPLSKGALHLRSQDGRSYRVTFGDKIQVQDFGSATGARSIKTWDFPAGFDPQAEHTVEYKVQGETLSLAIDGTLIGTVEDTALTAGSSAGLSVLEGALVRALEFSGGPPASPAP
jgi:serine/threonine protein kinase